MENGITKRSIAQLSVDTQILYDRLKKLAIGECVAYEELSKLIDCDVQFGARSNLDSARRKLLREDRIVLGVIVKEGLQRLDDSGMIAESGRKARHIARTARSASRILFCVGDFNALSNDKKLEHNVRLAQMGALSQMAGATGSKKILEGVKKKADRLSIGQTLELFKS